MNIFYLDKNPIYAAIFHCDQHLGKMVVESAQILSAAADRAKCHEPWMYKVAYRSHPCTIWAADDKANVKYIWLMAHALSKEIGIRFPSRKNLGKVADLCHKIADHITINGKFTGLDMPVAQAMPDEIKIAGDPVQAYRNYYNHKNSLWVSEGKPAMTWAGKTDCPF